MPTEESLKNFISSIIFLVKLFAGLKDKFLAQKLYDKISGFIAGHVKLLNSRGEKDETMSHNIIFIEFKNTVDNLLEFLDYMEHSKSVFATPLLYARRNLLDFKLNLVRLHNQPIQIAPKPIENKPTAFISKNVQPRNFKESSTKERIFNFIKRSPNSRTKEIVYEFNILSNRTVKRNLKELLNDGFIKKISKDKAVYYTTK